jgi:hypothetical protein
MFAFDLIDLVLQPDYRLEDRNDDRLVAALQYVANAGANADPTELGQQFGYIISHVKPRLTTASGKAQQANLDPAELERRFSDYRNMKWLAQKYLAQRGQGDPHAIKSFSSFAAHNLGAHLLSMSRDTRVRDAKAKEQLAQTARAAQQAAAQVATAADAALRQATGRARS